MGKKVLIIQNKFVGDVLASSVIANNLKQIDPNYSVDFLCYAPAVAVLKENPFIHKVISFDDKKLKKLKNLIALGKEIRKESYDIVIDPYAKIQSRYLTWASRATIKIGYDRSIFKYLYTHRVDDAEGVYKHCAAIEDRLSLLQPLNQEKKSLDYSFKIYLSEEEKNEGREILEKNHVNLSQPTLMIGVLGSSPSKSWTLNKMADLVNFLLDNYDVNLLFNYMPSQKKSVDELMKTIKPQARLHTTIIGRNIREYLKIMANCDAYIGNEGGGLNMAKGLAKPTFSIYSPHKFPEVWGCMENLPQHGSVHLREVKPELYVNPNFKELEKNSSYYYNQLTVEAVTHAVKSFLKINFNK